jgi:DNA modification methylase
MKAELVPIDSISLDPANLRRHPTRNLAAIVESLKRFGQQRPILVDAAGIVRAGNGTLMAAKQLGYKEIQIIRSGLKGSEATAYAIADNRTAELAEWETDALAQTLSALQMEDEELFEATGFDAKELDAMVLREINEDDVPEPPADPITKRGDVWLLGSHRVMCGDSTSADDVARLMRGERAQLVHADPPYGMGKEKDGVQNDNLYDDKLDAFQMAWWRAFRPHIEDNASAYIWGNAEGLWRLWFIGGLSASERMTMRNQIIWNKPPSGLGDGQNNSIMRSFGVKYESCIFLMLGEQGFNNNADNYWEGWEPIRAYLETEMNKCGGAKNWKTALGNQMGGHYFTKSQWCFPTEEAYKKLQAFANGNAFKREHDELKREYDELKREFYATRAHFDNTHDLMTDVWEFPRVTGEEKHGHATPKPVAMMARCIKSSAHERGVVVEPFLGSGSTLIAAEQLGRKCYGMEISPAYCDVIVKRWETLTGKKARLG